eukprot:COSAG02_NODE_61051_length_269_cov_1.205882_1_plen_38_part_10
MRASRQGLPMAVATLTRFAIVPAPRLQLAVSLSSMVGI